MLNTATDHRNPLVTAITDRLDELAENAGTDYAEQIVEGHRADLDSGQGLVRLALELDLDPSLPCYIARADGCRPAGPFDSLTEANDWTASDDCWDVEQITVEDAARLFPACRPVAQATPTALTAPVRIPPTVRERILGRVRPKQSTAALESQDGAS
ncbi:hypothetical protein [Umezawaea tangerina]|uniref:Uncharacterized protein n=1 Tax=Umezawaea tangerina TaxID=84725 RepID=A0A2T0SPH0_9PSEU|nr:hypothetical protein [Umezawaea tangerina]PRY35296.1 hypothetical protein CLV43_114214 [Umezawaea tangerina]